jgi:hypothetical protein
MNRSRLGILVLAAFALATLVGIGIAVADEPSISGETRHIADDGTVISRCGTVERGNPKSAPDADQIRQWISENRIAAGGVIPVNFHVISGRNGEGNVPESWLDAQILVLNRNYAGRDYNGNIVSGAANTGYTFVKNSVTRTSNKRWFAMTPGSSAEAQAKNALHVNTAGSLNFYTAKPGQNLLGWATFPWNLASNPNMDGVVVHYASLPGGSLSPYNLGGTGSHEVGHWVGLYHTFQGGCGTSDCANSGDLVCDTPAEGTATSGCPSNKDTCSGAGLDPVHNYMDYSTDICYTNFTPGQDARADFMMSTYRPIIGSAKLADLIPPPDDPTDDFRPNEGHGPRKSDAGETLYRCASDDRGKHVGGPDKKQIDLWIAENRIAAGGVIPVHVHVIYSGGTGNIPQSQIDAQIAVLNNNYAGKDYNGNVVPGAANTGYTFVLASVDRTSNRKWFKMTPGSSAESRAKNALAIDQDNSLNLYTAAPGQNLLGWATFPWDLQANGKRDGVVIHYGSVPGGYLSPYNLGGTASHEVGHWVGLYHTFQGACGSDCATTGDLVCDTPAEGTATSGCPSNKDTCAGTGLDPVHNYMDYSTDICYTNFTPGQDARADYKMSTYRPGVGSAIVSNPGGDPQAAKVSVTAAAFGLRAIPNPFNPRTKIEFSMARDGDALVRVFDVQGRAVATIVDGRLPRGVHRYTFDGDRLASGIYWIQLRVDGTVVDKSQISLLK